MEPLKQSADSPFDIVFLDRDGTINEQVAGYVSRVEDLILLPGAADAIARLNRSGCPVVVVTNQQGLATGRLTWDQYRAVAARLDELLARDGAHLDLTVVCPHRAGTCRCRKPEPGMLLDVLAEHTWATPDRCVLVGDALTDVQAARAAGIRALQLGSDTPSLASAVELLLTESDACSG